MFRPIFVGLLAIHLLVSALTLAACDAGKGLSPKAKAKEAETVLQQLAGGVQGYVKTYGKSPSDLKVVLPFCQIPDADWLNRGPFHQEKDFALVGLQFDSDRVITSGKVVAKNPDGVSYSLELDLVTGQYDLIDQKSKKVVSSWSFINDQSDGGPNESKLLEEMERRQK